MPPKLFRGCKRSIISCILIHHVPKSLYGVQIGTVRRQMMQFHIQFFTLYPDHLKMQESARQ